MARATGTNGRERPPISRAERILATMAATVIGLSVLAFVAVLLAGLAGVKPDSGVWPVIVLLPLIGLPIGFLLMVAIIIINAVKRARQARTPQ